MSGDWREIALCREVGLDLFFPEKGDSVSPAKAICSACEVRGECLQEALESNQRFGVWGGLTERERRPLRAARREEGVVQAGEAA